MTKMKLGRIETGTLLVALAAAIVAAASSIPALAVESGAFSMDVLVDGRPLVEYAVRGTAYVEALKGREFAIRLRNRTGGRIGVALAVDGLNSIDARSSSARDARKWILDPYETVTIAGWQTGSVTARRFFFTTEDRSYGAWLGKTGNLGVIAASVFREKRPAPAPWSLGGRPSPPYRTVPEEPSAEVLTESSAANAPNAADGATAAGTAPSRSKAEGKRAARDEYAATGIGRETSHPVVEVEFDAEDAPCVELRVRYEYRDALARLGVLPAPRPVDDPLARRERAQGFQEPGFAPDPYR